MEPVDIALFDAVLSGDPEQVREALLAGGDPNARDARPFVGALNTPLHYAALQGNREVVSLLIAAGADVNARCKWGWTPLMRACNGGYLQVTVVLLEEGADPHLVNSEGFTAYARVPADCPELLTLMKQYA
jgi:ankyrin repeat protein